MADATQPATPEAIWLRQNWNRQVLGRFDRQWIAVKHDGSVSVISSSSDFGELLNETISKNPLYAFVYFGRLCVFWSLTMTLWDIWLDFWPGIWRRSMPIATYAVHFPWNRTGTNAPQDNRPYAEV